MNEIFLANRDTDPHPLRESFQNASLTEVYLQLISDGLESKQQLIAALEPDTLNRVMDLSVWRDDRIDIQQFSRWMDIFSEMGSDRCLERFLALDEELKIGAIAGRVDFYDDEEFQKLPPQVQDECIPLPDHMSYYRITDERLEGSFETFLNHLMVANIEVGMSWLVHGAYAVPSEAEALALQFRQARMEEEGFVSFREAFQLVSPPSRSKMSIIIPGGLLDSGNTDYLLGRNFSELGNFKRESLQLVNALTTLSLSRRDLGVELPHILEQVRSFLSLGAELLVHQNKIDLSDLFTQFSVREVFLAGSAIWWDVRRNIFNQVVTKRSDQDVCRSLFEQCRWQGLHRRFDDLLGRDAELGQALFAIFGFFPRALTERGRFELIWRLGPLMSYQERLINSIIGSGHG